MRRRGKLDRKLDNSNRPRWALTRWLVDTGDDMPAEIRVSLLAGLYGSLPIFAGGVINTLLVSAVIAARIPTTPFLVWAAIELALAIFRLPLLIAGRKAIAEGRKGPIDVYLTLAVLWAISVGYGTFISVLSGDWVVASLACLSAAAMVGGICFRNFAAPRLVAIMILASLGPCAVAAVLSGESILLVVAFQIPFYLFSMAMASFRVNELLVRTMRAEQDNAYRARHDVLTGVLNRAGLADEVAARRAQGDGAALSLFYLDLDGFKTINDTYGHATGDWLLRSVAERLQAVVRSSDSIARIGGDEFVVLSERSERTEVLAFGTALVATVADMPYLMGDEAAIIGVSIGVAMMPEHGEELGVLLSTADGALYQAKSGGRARCVIAAPGAANYPLRGEGRPFDHPAPSVPHEGWQRIAKVFGGR